MFKISLHLFVSSSSSIYFFYQSRSGANNKSAPCQSLNMKKGLNTMPMVERTLVVMSTLLTYLVNDDDDDVLSLV